MSRSLQAVCRMAAVLAATVFTAVSLVAQTSTNSASKANPDFFTQLRQLITMTPDERVKYLTNRPPEIRARVLAKVAEYEALDPDERELRLRATELRWYLQPLMEEESLTNRDAKLAQVPEDIRGLVKDRLMQWQILPPPLQQEFLENERTLDYFGQVPSAESIAILPDEKMRRIAAQMNQFFGLTPDEKQAALTTLSDAERAQMEKTLKSFDKLTAEQRQECVNAFAKFTGMSAPQRTEFLKNAARWSEMSPSERQAWRDLVVNVPQWPPFPPGMIVSSPKQMTSSSPATN